jgi:hypothetical protein
VRDWTVSYDVAKLQGRRAVRARLLDSEGQELRQTLQIIYIDGTAPADLRITGLPAQAKKGTTLTVTALAQDPESGIAAVEFFAGKPADGKFPAQARRVTAQTDAAKKVWTAHFTLPEDHTGPFQISMRASNGVGLASFTTATVDVTEVDPDLLVAGKIRGNVTEGPRPQPNLVVVLQDEKGKEVARTRTRADGTYTFENVASGRYQLFVVKPETHRRASAGAIVAPGRSTTVPLPLVLQ